MNDIDKALTNVIKEIPKDELEYLAYISEERGLDGLVERGGESFRELAFKERVSVEMSLGAILETVNDSGMMAANIAQEMMEEDE